MMKSVLGILLVFSAVSWSYPLSQRPRGEAESLEVDPPALALEVGESARLTATLRGADGSELSARIVFTSSARRSLEVDPATGRVLALAPGQFAVLAIVPGGPGRSMVRVEVPVTVAFPPLARIQVEGVPERLYAGTIVEGAVQVYDSTGALRPDADLVATSADPTVARIDRFGHVRALQAGRTSLRLAAGDAEVDLAVRVEENPAASIRLVSDLQNPRTGDVVHFQAVVLGSEGREVPDLPVLFSLQSHPASDNPAAPAAGLITADGRFVAELPGRYTVVASAGTVLAASTIEVARRDVARRLEVVGRGPVRDRHSSDLWIWEAANGRDYALTGTWRGDGEAYVWDVTDPARIGRVDTVRVDARTVNDVKVSEDGRVAVLSREGASNRRNGIVILDVTDPSAVETLAEFSDGLTGGVHNTFIYDGHVYAVNNGRSYDIIDITEPRLPFRVSRFELDTPAHSVHDVWVEDGIAYSSNWEDGVVLVDVGNGVAGGAPDHPVRFASYADPGGNTHAAFPFRSESTGRFYVVTGDELFPNGLDPEGPTVPAGYMHIVDFTDLENPVEVARFEVPETGSHNLWIEHDVLYAAFYNGGLRIVDLSGELMGDLYRQGREIARFLPKDSAAFVPNESMVWGAQPHKGVVYLSDWNSGLWALRLVDEE